MEKFRGKFNGHLIQEPLSQEAKYWLGLLITDGCLSYQRSRTIGNNTLYPVIGLGLKDHAHVKLFAEYCGVKSHSINCNNHKGYQIGETTQFGISKEHEERFLHYGIIPRKSGKEKPPPELIPDFDWWRGVIDGDGSLGFYKRCPSISLCGSTFLVSCFVNLIENLTNHRPAIRAIGNKGIYTTSAGGGENTKIVVEKIYYTGCYPVLERKNNIAIRTISWIKYPNKGELQANAKFTNEQIKAVRRDPRSSIEIAKCYRVSSTCVNRIKSRKSYISVL